MARISFEFVETIKIITYASTDIADEDLEGKSEYEIKNLIKHSIINRDLEYIDDKEEFEDMYIDDWRIENE